MPLDWNAPTGPEIDYFVQRVVAPHAPSRRVLVYLAGGPGASGNAGVTNAPALQAMVPDMDVVSPDHRGAGRSTWFGCNSNDPTQDDSLKCLEQVQNQFGPDAGSYFSATQAARDVKSLVDALRADGRQVLLYGESYGTFLVNRYLNMYPTGADAAVLDSVVRPDGHDMFPPGVTDFPADRAARQIFAACGADAFCSSKLGSDPWALLGALEGRLSSGFCAAAIPAGTSDAQAWLKSALYFLEATAPGATQTAFVYRLNRCLPADVTALVHSALHLAGPSRAPGGDAGSLNCSITSDGGETGNCNDAAIPDGPPTRVASARGANDLLRLNIAISDMFSERPAAADLLAWNAAARVNDETGLMAFFGAVPLWPLAPYAPGVAKQWAPTAIPLLLLNGDLDPETPSYVLDDARRSFAAAAQNVVIIPGAVHVTFEHSSATASTQGRPCGAWLVGSFLGNPTEKLDLACTNEIPALDFRGDATIAEQLFATADLYE